MALVRSATFRWGLVFLCLVLGTWFGLFMQRFAPTAMLFANVADFSFDIREINLVMLRFGFHFALKLNLGTLIGGVVGIWVTR